MAHGAHTFTRLYIRLERLARNDKLKVPVRLGLITHSRIQACKLVV